jgi:hypothetical protein
MKQILGRFLMMTDLVRDLSENTRRIFFGQHPTLTNNQSISLAKTRVVFEPTKNTNRPIKNQLSKKL